MDEAIQTVRLAIEREDYETAERRLLPLANAGSAEAQFLLGYLFFTSAEVKAEESYQWLEKAAAQEHPEALRYLATWRLDGQFGIPDDQRGRNLLVRAAELGSIQAQREVGCYYALGEEGWPLDPVLGRYWYGRAAAGGHADAQYNYGLMLLYGEGGPVDSSGSEWIQRAAAQKDEGALQYLKSIGDESQS